MNRIDLYQAFEVIDDDILERSERGNRKFISFHRRLPITLVAVLLALLLMGVGVVAVVYGDNIQTWFGHYFGIVTGQEMSAAQMVLLDHLSQEISQSQTVDGTTVTVDSVTVGDDNFYLLLRVEGGKFSERHQYHFDTFALEVSPEPTEDIGGLGRGGNPRFYGLDEDGVALMLLEFSYATKVGFVPDTTPLDAHLVLEDLICESPEEKLIAEGVWEFKFIIDRSNPPESISLSDTEVVMMDRHVAENVLFHLKKIELTNTGIRFQYDHNEGFPDVEKGLAVLLENGASIGYSGGATALMQDDTTVNCSYQWQIPVNLDEVKAVRIGNVDIPVR